MNEEERPTLKILKAILRVVVWIVVVLVLGLFAIQLWIAGAIILGPGW